MTAPPNVELEAAKFLHKLIQESKDEPTKLATKLYVILQHMRTSGKENSMPYQVISRAMETVINQHGLDIDALTSSRIPTTATQAVDSASSQFGGSSLRGGVAKEANTSLASGELTKADSYASNRPPVGPSSTGHDIYQGSVSHLNSKSLDHESPSSFDTRPSKSHSEENHDSPKWEKAKKKENKKGGSKRKRADPSLNSERQFGNFQPLESSTFDSGMDKAATKIDQSRSISVQSGEHGHFNNMIQSSSQMEHNAMRPVLRGKQEVQHQAEKSLDSTNLSNSLSRTPHSRHPEDIEVSSARNALSRQPGVSLPIAHDVLNSSGIWNQNKISSPFEKSQVPRFSVHAGGGNSSAETVTHHSAGALGKAYGMVTGTSVPYAGAEPGLPSPAHFSNSYDNHSLGPAMHKERSMEAFSSSSSLDHPDKAGFGKAVDNEGGNLHSSGNANNTVQGGMLNNVTEMTMRSSGKSPASPSPATPVMPFKEQHLKQLRAQCLVYLAFRNGLKPKKLHLDFALGNFFPKEEGSSREMIDQTGKEQLIDGTGCTPDVPTPFGRLDNSRDNAITRLDPSSVRMFADAKLTKEGDIMNMAGEKNGMPSGLAEYGEENRQLLMTRRKESELRTGEIAQTQLPAKGTQPDGFSFRASATSNYKDDLQNRHQQVRNIDQASLIMGMSHQAKAEVTGRTGNGFDDDASYVSLQSSVLNESVPEVKDCAPSQSYLPSLPTREHGKLSRMDGGNHLVLHDGSKIVPVDSALLNGNPLAIGETIHEEEDMSVATVLPPSPKYTTSEKWIIDQQKRKLHTEKTWALKQQRTQQRITACSDKLKDKVSSSEDISAKTRSVIELKKLQLLELQKRLRNDILNDFFKPITSDMDRLKSIKKHRIGRRSKQLEKYEQRMKEERQKRFRERQKEFFSEIEVHKERLEDVFKMRRERWKGFNRSVREFHKRKERVHREKIDRIQREKINLLKINDVEGYLRMVQDAKSDRVKQLLKETEKYLQKLGSKLRDAKALNRCFETEMDDGLGSGFMEKNEITIDNEDETDQAKHYLESNEKYYLMAHSIKENVAEQPSCLVGGKLREYQMNGLRWLVSLYNNHLNGILADEMGLGKTVQVISLICYLMETKNDRGPFLVVVPSSVLPGWESEINFWAPSINKIVYSGPPEERRRLFKERIVPQKFNVLLTTYEYLMNKHDRPKLSKIHWHYVIIDEGHRIKNASCKLNADLKLYHSSHRLLLTGTPLQNNLEELWALLNFLLPNIFNSSEDFSQWFNKPFESNGDSSPDEALLSEEENLLIINRLHQVLRPFVLRRLKHKVENQLPEKIERLVRCEASAYQKLLMKRVEDNLGALGTSKSRSVHNSVMELRNICNHPYLSQLHSEEVHDYIPKHYLPNIVRLCGKLEMLDRILPKLKATGHRVLLFSTMTRLLDVMEDYLYWKQYKYLRLDGHTSGGDRGALIDQYNKPDSPYFIFLLSIRAGGVGVNLQAADTVIIFDTDWNPQVDLQAQARAHRIGQKREVLVLRFETVQTVEEQVRAAAEHKLGVANQSITAGFFDNNTSAEDRREYLESLLRESKKEEAAPVLHDDAVNDLIARSESEIDIFESVDKRRHEEEMAAWKLTLGEGTNSSGTVLTLPSRLVTDEELKLFSEAMKKYDAPTPVLVSNVGIKRKGDLGVLDTKHYGRGKRAREVRSYEEQWTEDEFEKLCQVESPHSPKMNDETKEMNLPMVRTENVNLAVETERLVSSEQPAQPPLAHSTETPLMHLAQPLANPVEAPLVHSSQTLVAPSTQLGHPLHEAAESPVPQAASPVSQTGHPPILHPMKQSKEITPPQKRGRGRPKRATMQISPSQMIVPELSGTGNTNEGSQKTVSHSSVEVGPDLLPSSTSVGHSTGTIDQYGVLPAPSSGAVASVSASTSSQPTPGSCPVRPPDKKRGRNGQSEGEAPRRRGRKPNTVSTNLVIQPPPGTDSLAMASQGEVVSTFPVASGPGTIPVVPPAKDVDKETSSLPAKDVDKETSSLPLVPVLSPSSGTIKPHDAPVSSSPVLSNSAVCTGTSMTSKKLDKGTTDSQPILPVLPLTNDVQSATVRDPTFQQNPPTSSVLLGPQCVTPSDVVPKQVKGRGRKGHIEGEAPRRRGRKPNAASTAAPGSGGQEPALIGPHEKKSRVSSGRMTVAARRKQQTETQKSGDSIQAEASRVHTSDCSIGLGSSALIDRPYHSDQNNEGTSSTATAEVPGGSVFKEPANVKLNQLDAPVSGDNILFSNIGACVSSVAPVGIESHNSAVKDVPPAMEEVTVDTLSSQSQSSRSEGPALTCLAPSNLGTPPVSITGICAAQNKQDGGGKVEEITNASSVKLVTENSETNAFGSRVDAATLFSSATSIKQLTDVKSSVECNQGGAKIGVNSTDISGSQNLVERNVSTLSNLKTSTIFQSSDNRTNSTLPTLEAGKTSCVFKVGNPSVKEGENVDVLNPFLDESLALIPKVPKFECPKNVAKDILMSVTDNSKECSDEKPDAVVAPEDIPKEYAAMEKSGVDSSEIKGEKVCQQILKLNYEFEVVSGTKIEEANPFEETWEAPKGEDEHNRSEQNVESHAVEEAVVEEEAVVKIGLIQFQDMDGVGYKGRSEMQRKQEERSLEVSIESPCKTEERNVTAVEATSSQIEKDLSEGDKGILRGETQHGISEHGGGALLAEEDGCTHIPVYKEGEFKQVEEGCPGYMEDTDLISRTSIIDGNKAKTYQQLEVYEEETETKKLLVGLGQTQAEEVGGYTGNIEECSKKLEVLHDEDENGVPETIKERSDPAQEGIIEGKEAKSSERVKGVYEGVNAEHEKKEHREISHSTKDSTIATEQTMEEALARPSLTQAGEQVLEEASESESREGETLSIIKETVDEFVQTHNELPAEHGQTLAKEATPVENMEVIEETIQHERTKQQRGQVIHDTHEPLSKTGQITEEINVKQVLKEASESESREGETLFIIKETVDEFVQAQNELPAEHGQTLAKEATPVENMEVIEETIQHERTKRQGGQVIHDTLEPLSKTGQITEEINVKQCEFQTEAGTDEEDEVFLDATESESTEHEEGVVSHAVTEMLAQTGLTEELIDEQFQSRTQAEEVKPTANIAVTVETIEHEKIKQQGGQVLHDTGETLSKTDQITEEINVKQYQTQSDVRPDEEDDVFLDAREADSIEHVEGDVSHAVREMLAETGLTEEGLSDEHFQKGDLVNPCEKVENFQEKYPHDTREYEDGVLHATVDSAAQFEKTTENLIAGSCESQGKKDVEPLKELFIERSKFQANENSAPQEKIEEVLHTDMEITVRNGWRSEELPVDQCRTHTNEDSGPSDNVDVLHASMETTSEAGRYVEAEEDSEPFEMGKVPGESTSDRMEQGDKVLHDNMDITVELGQCLEEPCQTQMEDVSEASEKVEIFQEAAKHKATEEQGGEVHAIVETKAEIRQTIEEVPDKGSDTRVEEEANPSDGITDIPLGENVDNTSILQVDGVLDTASHAVLQIGQGLEEFHGEHCQMQGSEDSIPSEKAEEVLLEPTKHEKREEAAGSLLHATTETADIKEEFVGKSQSQAEEEVKPLEKVVPLNISTEHEREQSSGVSHDPEISAEMGSTECQVDEKEAGVPTEVKEVLQNEEIELQARIEVDGIGENAAGVGKFTEKHSEPDQSREDERQFAGSSEESRKDDNEMRNEVRSCTETGKGCEDSSTVHAAE